MDQGKAGLLIAFLLVVPMIAWIASRLLLGRGAGLAKALGDQALAEWHGTYYAFDDVQVRVYEEDGHLWFVAIDVARALRWKALPQHFMATHARLLHTIPGTPLKALDVAGLEMLLARKRDREAGRFLRWVHQQVAGPWERRREDRRRVGAPG